MEQQAVSALFGCADAATTSSTYTTWVLFLIIFFEQVMKVPTEEQVHSCYPKSVIHIWKNARTACVYGCTEFRMQAPTDRVSWSRISAQHALHTMSHTKFNYDCYLLTMLPRW